jgi:hypothetical protein
MGGACNRIARKSCGNFEIEGREYTDFWTPGMRSFSNYSLGARRFLNNACMKMPLKFFYNPVLKEEEG